MPYLTPPQTPPYLYEEQMLNLFDVREDQEYQQAELTRLHAVNVAQENELERCRCRLEHLEKDKEQMDIDISNLKKELKLLKIKLENKVKA